MCNRFSSLSISLSLSLSLSSRYCLRLYGNECLFACCFNVFVFLFLRVASPIIYFSLSLCLSLFSLFLSFSLRALIWTMTMNSILFPQKSKLLLVVRTTAMVKHYEERERGRDREERRDERRETNQCFLSFSILSRYSSRPLSLQFRTGYFQYLWSSVCAE